jgi:hypothetical protein
VTGGRSKSILSSQTGCVMGLQPTTAPKLAGLWPTTIFTVRRVNNAEIGTPKTSMILILMRVLLRVLGILQTVPGLSISWFAGEHQVVFGNRGIILPLAVVVFGQPKVIGYLSSD